MVPTLLDGARKTLLDLIKTHGSLSLDDATDRMHLAKTTVRQHLLQMENQGLIRRSYDSSGAGRPKLVFELSASGHRLYPTQEPELLRGLLEYLARNGQQAAIEAFFEEYWEKRKERFEAILASIAGGKSDPQQARLKALTRLLEDEGFMPQLERGPGKKITVRECNCPFPEAVRATRLPCKLESEFIRWALKTGVERTGYIPDGEAACTYSERK